MHPGCQDKLETQIKNEIKNNKSISSPACVHRVFVGFTARLDFGMCQFLCQSRSVHRWPSKVWSTRTRLKPTTRRTRTWIKRDQTIAGQYPVSLIIPSCVMYFPSPGRPCLQMDLVPLGVHYTHTFNFEGSRRGWRCQCKLRLNMHSRGTARRRDVRLFARMFFFWLCHVLAQQKQDCLAGIANLVKVENRGNDAQILC